MLRLDRTSRRWFAVVIVAVLAMVAAAGAQEARACGPEYPHQLLKDRRATMLELVEGSFAWEAAHLVAPAHPFVVLEYDDARESEARRAGGSIERTLYEEGAAHWRAGAHDDAIARWTALLALRPEDRPTRSTWAAFMLGKATGDKRWFARTRALAQSGAGDALGLATASFGEEALLELAAGDLASAVHLYAEQAALGSESGNTSLLFVARRLLADEDELAAHAHDPVVQKLVASYLFTRPNELADGKLERVLRAFEKRKVAHAPAADRLAAVAYRAARFDPAARFAALSDAPLSTWVQAKLALRDGRLDDARVLLARASAAFPAEADWGDQYRESGDSESVAPRCRVDAERAVLALEARDYAAALTHLLAGGDRYWTDAAYVAERVLSLAELESYVALHAPSALPPAPSRWELAVETKLRALLARRLMRAGRYADAARFFDDREQASVARRYGRAMLAGRDQSEAPVQRARALFEAATLARRHGIDVIAFELDPDWAIYEGEADLGNPDWYAPMPMPRGDVMVPGVAFATFEEQARVASTRAVPLVRWHYRTVASDLAAEAATLVPERSHAYAALLCTAASYVIDQQPDHATELWQRYARHGAAVDFAGTFGRACPPPDFDGISKRFDDDGRPRPQARAPGPLRKRDAARDAALLVVIALATHLLARLVSRRGRGSTGSPLP